MVDRTNQYRLLNTDYAYIFASSSHPSFELQLVKSGINPSETRIKTNFLTLVRQKPETPEQWATLTEAWEVACECKPSIKDFRLLAEFLWENQSNVEVGLDSKQL
ncbi:hypothetical protein [Microcoleus sp. herbarium2]|uniref:hypothetical protein n=1 Tax=Microcoleus sp. herbarium2 TaxID=3055433 RepID=UPI002FD4DBB5